MTAIGRKRVLIISEMPDRVDYPDPIIPRGAGADQLRLIMERELAKLRERGYDADLALATTEVAAAGEVTAALEAKSYDCIVVGPGLRLEPPMTRTFEAVMNVVREHAPGARLAFDTSLRNSAEAAERQLGRNRSKSEAVDVCLAPLESQLLI